MKHKILGYAFVVVVAAAIVSGIYYWDVTRQPIPPGPTHKDETATWQTYQDSADTFSVKYPQEDRLDPVTVAQGFGTFGTKAQTLVAVAVPQSVFPNTNFQDSYVVVAKSTSIKNAADCKKYSNGSAQLKNLTTSETINGTTYDTAEYDGVAAGNLYDTKIYRVFHAGSCYEVALTLHTTNIGNYDPSSGIKEVNAGQAWSKLIQVLNTVKFAEDMTGKDKDTVACGGLAGIPCPTRGYTCQAEGNFPDAMTFCKKDSTASDQDSNLTLYTNGQYGFQFKYPSGYDKLTKEPSQYIPVQSEMNPSLPSLVRISIPQNVYAYNTDFDGAYFTVYADSGVNQSACQTLNNNWKTSNVKINGLTFLKGVSSGAGMSHQAEDHVFRLYTSGGCIEIMESLRTGTGGEWVKQYVDSSEVFGRLDAILNTFVLTNKSASGWDDCPLVDVGGIAMHKCQ